MKDFFISYTESDKNQATWVAELLETNDKTVVIQAWDFHPGDNFVKKINQALSECKTMIVILSEKYLQSGWCEAEWTAKFKEQIEKGERCIIPICIEPIKLKGLLSPIEYINIVDKSQHDAEQEILYGISDNMLRKSKGFQSYYNLEHSEIDIDYYVQKEAITYIKTCKSKILIEGKNKIHNRITWFADEKITLMSLTQGVTIEYLDLKDTNLNYNVVFDHILKKGERIEYRIKAVLTDEKKHFKNFFSSEIIVPVNRLSMHLNIEDTKVKYIYTQKLSSSPMNVRTEVPKQHEFYSPFHWSIEEPELNFEYKIFW